MSVARAKREIDSREFVHWRAWSQIEPFGDQRADLRLAQAAYQLCRFWGGEKVRFKDFLLDFHTSNEPAPEKNEAIANGLIGFFQALITSKSPIVKVKRPEDADNRCGSDTSDQTDS